MEGFPLGLIKKLCLLMADYKGRQMSMKEHRLYTPISRKVVGKNGHAIIPKGNMGCS